MYLSMHTSIFDQFHDPFGIWPSRSSVYVISDSQLKEYKDKQRQLEIKELEKLVDGHKTSIERLQTTIDSLKAEVTELG